MELDINTDWVNFSAYHPRRPEGSRRRRTAENCYRR